MAKLPLLIIKSVVHHLHHLQIEQHFSPFEADKDIAELAISRNAFILSLDSDFFVIGSDSLGYIPLDSLEFFYQQEEEGRTVDVGEEEGWQSVTRSKSSRKVTSLSQNSLLPALTLDTLQRAHYLRCTSYQPKDIASQLSISANYLPLLAALCNNDYYQPPVWKSVASPSGGKNSESRRIEIIAKSLLKHTSKSKVTSETMYSISAKIFDEVREFSIPESELSVIVVKALDTLPHFGTTVRTDPSYFQIQPPSSSSPSSLSIFIPTSFSDPNSLLKTQFLNAYESGNLRRELLQILVMGIYAPAVILEEPDLQSCMVSCARGIRRWIYALLNDAVGIGLLNHQEEEEGETWSRSWWTG